MTQAEDDEWAKLREMVRNAPPGTAQTQWNPHELADEPRRRAFPKKAFFVLLLLCVAGGAGYYAFEQRDELFGANDGTSALEKRTGVDGSATPAVPAQPPAAQAKPQPETAMISIRKGAKSINVRAGPSAASLVVGRLSGGDRAEKTAENDGWVRLRFEASGKSIEGWVRRDLLAE